MLLSLRGASSSINAQSRLFQTLSSVAEVIKNFAVIYLVDIDEVPHFNHMYELYDPCTVMFFFRNKQIQIDLGTGNNNKINWAMTDKQEFIDIVDTVFRCCLLPCSCYLLVVAHVALAPFCRGAKKGRGLVVSPKDYSTKYRY